MKMKRGHNRQNTTTADSYLVTWTVQPGEVGMRLDLFLREKYRRLSREYLQKAIKEGRVTLNHENTKPSRILRVHDKVYVLSVKKEEPEVDFNYKVLYEDQSILVVDKPGNLPVHPSGRFFFNTLLTQLQVVNGNEVDQEKKFYIVHRVDRETSGVLVMGKTSEAAASLVDQFTRRKTEKEYLAIVRGVPEKDVYNIDVPLAKDPRSEIALKMHAVELGADGNPLYIPKEEVWPAQTEVRVLERMQGFALVSCKPHTGRQHQIRVHLEHIGFPIIGDKLYGAPADLFLKNIKKALELEVAPGFFLSRHALHAHKLSLKHPATGERMEFSSELPEVLESFLVKSRAANIIQ